MIRFLYLVLGCLVFAANPLTADPGDSTDSTDPTGGEGGELSRHLEHQTFDLINAYRAGQGLPPLVWSREMADLARQHSRDMATGEVGFGHQGFGDRMSRLRSLFPGMHGGGENVFESDDTGSIAQFAVANWLKSPPHLHNIRGDYNHSGLGLWRSRTGVYYFTQIFLKTE